METNTFLIIISLRFIILKLMNDMLCTDLFNYLSKSYHINTFQSISAVK